MTTAEVFARPVAVPVTAEPPAPAAAPVAVRFLGKEADYWRLRIKGAALVIVTLGLYRFWLATQVRRFLWSNTEIAGDTLEYNGLSTELLLGFLLGVALLVPLYMAFAVAALADTVTLLSVTLGVSLIAYLVEFARYRARRYRLTRTVFRGVRFDQHGRAWDYALRALGWWALVIVTLGLAYPWAQASLQRFKLRNTCYGDLPGRFEGSASALLVRGLPIWLLVIGPIVIAVAVLSALIDWDRLSDVAAKGDDDTTAEFMGTLVGPGLDITLVALAAGVVSLVLLYPLFRTVMLRWWISGLRFGEVTVTSRLRSGQVYRVYGRFVLYLVLFVALAVGTGVGCLYLARFLLRAAHDANLAELAASTITVLLYVVVALGASTIYQVVVTAGLWRLGAQSAELSGAQALDNVRAAGAASSALGEGLADALGVGGI
jgi:uncharacterized membrane protein YjgN (DUF898 family)